MIRLSANLSFLFSELPFLERFEAAARAGFRAVELAFPYDFEPAEIIARLRRFGLQLVLVNAPAGDLEAGELGLAALPGRDVEAQASFSRALDYAEALDVPRIHLLAGNASAGADRREMDEVFLRNISSAADQAATAGREILLEPLNSRDRPRYHLRSTAHARRLIRASGRGNVRLQLDLYHCRFDESDLLSLVEREIDLVGHIQIANYPDRREPTPAGIDYVRVFSRLDELGYEGYVGCEYLPSGDTASGLEWARPYLW